MSRAISKHGFLKGYIMGCDRLLRENSDPWVYKTALIDGQQWKIDFPP
jgi:putative component of membrane protein insertase Oxa1/YidC/SpoIIIJ protein YidD